MNINSHKRQVEAKALVATGWTRIDLTPLDVFHCVNPLHNYENWIKRQQEEYAWCVENARGDFRFVHPNSWLFKDNAVALMFKLTWAGE